jgi:hypothetical protein
MLFHVSKTWADQARLLRNVIDDTATLGNDGLDSTGV